MAVPKGVNDAATMPCATPIAPPYRFLAEILKAACVNRATVEQTAGSMGRLKWAAGCRYVDVGLKPTNAGVKLVVSRLVADLPKMVGSKQQPS